MSKQAVRLVGLVMLISACTPDPTVSEPAVDITGSTPPGSTADVTGSVSVGSTLGRPAGLFASELVEFDTCDAFVQHMKSEALERVGPYGFGRGGSRGAAAAEMSTNDSFGSADEAAFAPTAGVDYSTTNVQEVGVDEPDVVKTDGTRILAVARAGLHHIEVSSGAPVLVSSLELRWENREMWNTQLFMRGDTALLMASGYSDDRGLTTVVTQIDLSIPEELRIVNTLTVDGGFVSARLVGERVALVVASEPPVSFEFLYPSSGSRSAELRAERVNRRVIEESSLENWVPRYELKTGTDGTPTEGLLIDCSTAYAPQEFSGFGILSVLTFDLTEDIEVGAVASVMSGGNTVYASTDRLYVANRRWIDWGELDERKTSNEAEGITTHIHRFDIGGSDGPVYKASGSVDGFLLSQFAMSEHDGYLRVASTDAPPWGWWGDERTSESRVDVLERDGRELRVVGSVGGLGEGERIFAVRFMGEVGYVVTFRQTDPLYTIDLSDPTDPKVVGELKILGYSAYLHPIGNGLLLGVGQDADAEGRITGTQISIFDVSDLSNPIRTHQYTLPESSRSEVEFNHRAFLYWEPAGMAVLPVGWWRYDEDTDTEEVFLGAIALSIGPDGIGELGMVEHEREAEDGEDWYYHGVPINRSLVIGDTLFTLSEIGLKGSDLSSLSETSWILLPFE